MIEAEVIKIEIDSDKNIRVWATYKIDGVDVQSTYPLIDGHNVYCTKYNALSFLGMTDAEMQQKILKDIRGHVDVLIGKEFYKVANADVADKSLSSLIGQKVSADSTVIHLDPSKEITIYQDGTKGQVVSK